MHSKILQISSKPIGKDDYTNPDMYTDTNDSFYDYIGDLVEGEERDDSVGHLAELLKGVFKPAGRDCLVYLGGEALGRFLQSWANELKAQANELTADNILNEQRLNIISATTKETHLRTGYRVHIEEWNGWAGPFGDLIEWAACNLKEGDMIYVGAVIDYHY